jgi:homocysteine S-methyltransferase
MKNVSDLSFDTLFTHSPILLDGGFVSVQIVNPHRERIYFNSSQGTTLEDDLGVKISHSPLWSAQPLTDNEDSIIEAHLLFLRSGSKIISTAT